MHVSAGQANRRRRPRAVDASAMTRDVQALGVLGQEVGDGPLTKTKTPGAVEIAVFTNRRSSWVTVMPA
jgi:hypothetical protein